MNLTLFLILEQQQCASIPEWMKDHEKLKKTLKKVAHNRPKPEGNRIVGGRDALAPVPWQASF